MPESKPAPTSTLKRLGGWLRHRARLQIVVPAIIAVGLVAYVISVAIAPKSGGELWDILRATWWIVLLLTFPYLALRAFIWRRLLAELNIRIAWRTLLVSFAAGEMTKFLPAGIYVENYILARLARFREHATSRSSMATTATLGLEAFVAVPALLLLGLPGERWLPWTLGGIVILWVVVLVAAWLLVRYGAQHLTAHRWNWLQKIAKALEEFLEAGGDLITWRTATNIIPTALYMLIYVIDLYLIINVLGIHGLTFFNAVAIYAFVALTVILVPIPTEIGLTEFSGLTALLAFGIPGATAAVIMLGLRALTTGMTIVVSGLLLLILRDEFSHPQQVAASTGLTEHGTISGEVQPGGTP